MLVQQNELDKGYDETRYCLFQFLQERSDKAFTVGDLLAVFFGVRVGEDTPGQVKAASSALTAMLDQMVRASFVDKKVVDGEAYYSFNGKKKGCSLTRLASHLWVLY